MKYGTCLLAQAPLRAEAAHRSEMVSQILFGETCIVLKEKDNWFRVRLTLDSYEGWVDKTQITMMSDAQYHDWTALSKSGVTDFDTKLYYKGGFHRIAFGTLLPVGAFKLCDINFERVQKRKASKQKATVKQLAYGFLDVPYLWGGRTQAGIDCSGFTQLLYRTQDVFLLRDSSQQVTQGSPVENLQAAISGDLVFFTQTKPIVSHVGILLSSQEVIHASGKVKINRVDQQGIIGSDGSYTHRLHSIRRVIENPHLA